MKKILMGLAPLLAVAAFAVMPAMASAANEHYGTCVSGAAEEHPPCPEGEKTFTAFPELTPVFVKTEKAFGTGNFVLTNVKTTAKIECEGLIDQGELENIEAKGFSYERLVFHHCFTLFETKKCRVSTAGAGSGVIVGIVSDEVLAGGLTVKVNIVRGFNLVFSGPPPAGCPAAGTAVGKVAGTTTGAQARGSNVLKFAATTGLTINGEEATITGSDETYTDGGRPVVID